MLERKWQIAIENAEENEAEPATSLRYLIYRSQALTAQPA